MAAEFAKGIEGAAPDDAATKEGEDHGAEEGVDKEGSAEGQGDHIEEGNAGEVTGGVAVRERDHGERHQAGAADGPGSEQSNEWRKKKKRQGDDAG